MRLRGPRIRLSSAVLRCKINTFFFNYQISAHYPPPGRRFCRFRHPVYSQTQISLVGILKISRPGTDGKNYAFGQHCTTYRFTQN